MPGAGVAEVLDNLGTGFCGRPRLASRWLRSASNGSPWPDSMPYDGDGDSPLCRSVNTGRPLTSISFHATTCFVALIAPPSFGGVEIVLHDPATAMLTEQPLGVIYLHRLNFA